MSAPNTDGIWSSLPRLACQPPGHASPVQSRKEIRFPAGPGREWTVTSPDELIRLDGGGRSVVYRRGDVVVRETGPWAPAVHALLRHLEQAGFTAAPRLVGP